MRDEGARGEMIRKIGEGSAEVTNFKEQAHIAIEYPEYAKISSHLNLFEMDNITTSNTTNLMGYKCFLDTVKILTAFLSTHHYAAFNGPTSSNISSVTYASCHLSDESSAAIDKRQIDYTSELRSRGLPPVTPSSTRRNLVGFIPENHDGVWNLQGVCNVAQPSPFAPEINFGPAGKYVSLCVLPVLIISGAVPNLPGYVLPYFDGLVTPDINFLPSIMRRFFLRSFGKDDEAIDKNFKAWKQGHGTIFRTNSGKILAHIFLCLQAALEAQGRLFVIQSGRRYLGCAVIGYNFHLTIGGVIKTPETAETLRSLLTQMDPHMQAIEDIVEVLRGLDLHEEGMEDLATGNLTSGKEVWRAINKRIKPEDDEMKALRDAVDRLSFEERYLTMSKPDILRWIRLMTPTPGDEDEVRDLPMYLSGEMMYNTTRTHEVLSAFGPMAPSFLNLSGGRFKFPSDPTQIDHASIPDEANAGKRPLERLLIVGKKIAIACSDWNKMLRSREISQNQSQRASGYKNVAFTEKSRDEIWEALKRVPPFIPVNRAKRARSGDEDGDDESGDEGKKKKKARTAKETAVDLFADL